MKGSKKLFLYFLFGMVVFFFACLVNTKIELTNVEAASVTTCIIGEDGECDTTPVWYTSNVSSVNMGTSVYVKLTSTGSIASYSSSTYYKYGWSTSSSSSPSTWLTTFSSQTKTIVSFYATAPTVTSNTTYYLWIYNQGADTSGNVSTFSGKTPYYSGTTAGSYVKYQYTVNYADSNAPVWYTEDTDEIDMGSSVYFELTDDISLFGYSSASSYYKYGWSTSSSSSPTYKTTFSSTTSTKVSFYATAPTVTSDTTYYLWIYEQGKDSYGNVATFSGKTPYYSGTTYTSYVKYKYTVKFVDSTAPVWYTSNVSSINSGSSVYVELTDETALWGYGSAKTYYKYGWSTASGTNPSVWSTVFNAANSTEVSFYATVPTVTSDTTYYLWICYQGKDAAGNVATFSGKTPYYSGTLYSSYVKYQYTVIAGDTTAPTITCGTSLSTTRTYKNSSCSLVFSDNKNLASYTISGAKSASGTISGTSYTYGTLSTAGAYTIVVKDAAGNSKTGYLTLDFTAPVMRVGSSSGTALTAGSTYYYNSNKTFYFSDALSGYYRILHDYETAPQDGVFYSTATSYTLNMEVKYTITVYDYAGNSAKFYIVIDKTAPTITCGGTTLSSSSSSPTYKTANCSLGATDNFSLSGYDIKIDGSWSDKAASASGTSDTFYTLSSEGVYEITVEDTAGNSTTGYLTLDKTAPVMRVGSSSGTALTAGSTYYYTANKTFYFSDATSGYYRILHDYETAPQDGVFYSTATSYTLNMEVKYTITVYDYAGNSAKFYIVIDKTAPTITCGGTTLSTSRTYKNASCTLSFSDTYFSSYSISGAVSTSGTSTSYTLSSEGAYTVIAYDKAGNSKTGYITIDKTAPIMTEGPNGTALTAGGTINYFAGSDIEFYFYDDLSGFYKATHDFATAPSSAIYDTTNSSMVLSTGLEYRITLYDIAGNKATYYVILDNTAPVWTATNSSSLSYGSSVTVTLTESGENPSGIYNYSSASSYYKYGWSTSSSTVPTTWSTTFTSTSSTKVAFTTSTPTVSSHSYRYLWIYNAGKDNAGNVATYSGKSFYESVTSAASYIKYQYYVYASDRTAPTITCGGTTLSTSSSSPTYKNANCSLGATDNVSLSSYDIKINGSWSDKAASASGTSDTFYTLSYEGVYEITVSDSAGNSTTGYLTLDKTAPVMRVGSSSGTALTAGSTYYYNSNKTFYFSDALSGYYRILHDYETAPQDGIFYITATSYTLNMEVKYYITVYDKAGNSAKFYIVIDKTAPAITCGGTTLSSSSSSPTYKTSSCSLIFNDNISLYDSYYNIYKDGTRIDKSDMSDTTSYTYGTLSTEGVYEITIDDAAGNSTTGYLTLDKTAPVMRVGSSSGTALNVTNSNETIINYFTGESKTFYFSDALSGYYRAHHDYVTAPSSALYYTTSSSITLYEGYVYRITVYDIAGNSAKYMIKLSGSTDNISTDAILASATLSNGKITFNKASSNNIQEIYKNGTVRYFIGKPDVYDSNLSDAFDKYGVTVSASTFFASAWTTPQGLVGQFKLYVELSGTNLTTIFAKSSAINITNSGTSTTSFALELDKPLEEKVVDPVVALSTSNIIIKDTALETNYLLFVSMIVISSLLAVEVIIIKNSKKKKAHN